MSSLSENSNDITDYQNEIKNLRDALAQKTAIHEMLEKELVLKTQLLDEKYAYATELEVRNHVIISETLVLMSETSMLEEELHRKLQMLMDNAKFVTKILS